MNKYTLTAKYQSGDSFGYYEHEEEIGLVFDSKEHAQNALQLVKEHYDFYTEWEHIRGKEYEFNKKVCSKEWCKKACEIKHELYGDGFDKKPEGTDWIYNLAVKLNDTDWHVLDTPWIGYFEKLHSARVTIIHDPKDEITF